MPSGDTSGDKALPPCMLACPENSTRSSVPTLSAETPAETLRVDAGTSLKLPLDSWSNQMDALVTPAASEAHTSNAMVERRHWVFREALENLHGRASRIRSHVGARPRTVN